MPIGRPTKYKEEYCELLVEHMSRGRSFTSFAGVIKVSRQTLYQWAKDIPDFSYNKSVAEACSELFWGDILIGQADGSIKGNSSVPIFVFKNRFGYRDNPEPEIDDQNEVEFKE